MSKKPMVNCEACAGRGFLFADADKEPAPQWRCFHCNEAFADAATAALHFGSSERQRPACSIDIVEYRAMEKRMEAYNEEDADIHRRIRDVEFSKAEAVRDAEQRGYDRGLRDADVERVNELNGLANEMDISAACSSDDAYIGWERSAAQVRERAEKRTIDGGWRTKPQELKP